MDDLPQGILSQAFTEQPSFIRGWSNEDMQRQLAYSLLHGADWAQTRTIAKNPQQFHETNPILGEHPSTGTVNNYFLSTLLGHWLLSNALPPEYRKLFQQGSIGLEAGVAGKNKFKFGIGMTF
jgi:hypothetical protein